MNISTEGIVLKQRKIANNRRMITVFTRKYGKIGAGTSINEKSKTKSALALRPFTYAEYDIFKGRESYSINSAQVMKSYYSIGEDFDRFLVASKFIEYLDRILEDEHPRPKIFDMTLEFLESISRANGNYETLLYAFIVKTLRVQGVMPELGCCVNCGKDIAGFGYDIGGGKKAYSFSVSSGGIICENCAEREKTGGNSLIYRPQFDIITIIGYFMEQPLEKFEKVSLKPEVSKQIKIILGEYIDHYMGVDVLFDDVEWR